MKLLPFEYAVRNLGRAPSRLFLSVAGSTLVVMLVLIAGGFVRGMSKALATTGGENNVILLGAGSEDSLERSEIEAATPGVIAASIQGIRVRAGVPYVSAEVHVMLPVGVPAALPGAAPELGRQILVRGVLPEAALVHERLTITQGRWPRGGEDEVMIGRMAPTVLGISDAQAAIGSKLLIDKRPWTIVGHFTSPGTVVEAEVWLPLADIKTATKRETISCVLLTLDPFNAETGEGAEFGDVAAFAKSRPDLELVALTEREYFSKLSEFFGPIRLVAWVTAGLIAIGGLFGGLNTMYAAFASRTREIGTLQSLGYRRTAILISMVQEATLATAAGALVACGLGAVLLDGVAVRFSMGAFGLALDHEVITLGLGCGLLLGIFGALPPAVRCLRPTIPLALKAV